MLGADLHLDLWLVVDSCALPCQLLTKQPGTAQPVDALWGAPSGRERLSELLVPVLGCLTITVVRHSAQLPTKSGAGNPSVNSRGQMRANDTHLSTTDPDARLYKSAKGQKAILTLLGPAMMENRNGLAVQTRLTKAKGIAEREASPEMAWAERQSKRGPLTLGGDKL